MATVKFTFEDKKIEAVTVKDVKSDLSILEVAEENGVNLNHNCGGVCACSTCHMYLEKGDEFVEEISDKEMDVVDRAINPRLESRLGCQCIILEENAEIEVKIPDRKRIIGHEQ